MPVLPISDGAGSLVQLAGERVFGVMLYPHDEAGRKRVLTLDITEQALRHGGQPFRVPRELLEDLLDLPTRKQLAATMGKLTEEAWFSTRILQYAITLHRYAPKHASVLRGVEILVHFARKHPGLIASSPAHIKQRWRHFKAVAHLWCASFQVKTEMPEFQFSGLKGRPLLRFLAVAEWYRRQGESIVARAQAKHHGPILDPQESWVPPADLLLPGIEVELGKPTKETLEVLRRYRA